VVWKKADGNWKAAADIFNHGSVSTLVRVAATLLNLLFSKKASQQHQLKN
jgi:hypothetical protein